jgi:hypothetical protein
MNLFLKNSVIPVVCGLCLSLAPLARAETQAANNSAITSSDREQAAQLFRAGQDAFSRQDYVVAARLFEQAHRLVPSGSTIYNAARSWDASLVQSSAAAAYAEALEQADLSEAQRGHSQKRLAELGPVAPPVAPAVKTSPIAETPVPVAAAVKVERTNYVGWTGTTIAAGGLVASAAAGWLFLSKRGDFVDGGNTNRSLRDDAVLWGTITSVAMVATVVGAGIAVWGFHANAASTSADVSLNITPAGLSMRGSF